MNGLGLKSGVAEQFSGTPIRGALLAQEESESNDILNEFFRYRNVPIDCFYLLKDAITDNAEEILCPRLSRSFRIEDYSFCYGRTWGSLPARNQLHRWQRIFADQNVLPLDPLAGVQNNDDKLRMVDVFSAAGIPTPLTIVIDSGSTIGDAVRKIRAHLRGKVVVKANGSGGKHVHFASASRNAIELIRAISLYCLNDVLREPLVVQEYMRSKDETNHSYHYRALVVNGQLLVVMQFKAANPETLASNITNGGSAEIIPIDRFSLGEQLILRQAAKAMKINIAGIDFLKTESQPLTILEVNNSPGLYTAYGLGVTEHLDAIVGFAILTATTRHAKLRKSAHSNDPSRQPSRKGSS